ncbi:MAG: hypothetical protein RB294_10285, partial [Bacteroidales bacterium]|nr:hypothetical protein [Bacteroidales bacterium]
KKVATILNKEHKSSNKKNCAEYLTFHEFYSQNTVFLMITARCYILLSDKKQFELQLLPEFIKFAENILYERVTISFVLFTAPVIRSECRQ